MAEISLILTSPNGGLPATTIALAESGIGVSSISQTAIESLLQVRDHIVRMMKGERRMTSAELRQFGENMCGILFSQDVGATWNDVDATLRATARANNAVTRDPLVTRILATTPELKSIPWEYAAWPSGQAGPLRLNSIVRIVPLARGGGTVPLQREHGLRILLLSASPLGLDAIPWTDIRDTLFAVFASPSADIEVVTDNNAPATNTYIRIVEAATRSAVDKWVRNDDPHVIHFVGHGTHNGLSLIDSRNGNQTLMSAAAFQGALQSARSLRLVILSACDAANNAALTPVDASIGTFAEQIVQNVVPAVVASQMVIEKRTIAAFCEALYRELLYSGSIDVAVAAGRCSIAQALDASDSAAIEWGIPVLYRSTDGWARTGC
jgi:hypothetical protein